MKANRFLVVKQWPVHTSVWGGLCALAVGALLSLAVMLCSQWMDQLVLLQAVFQSALSAAVLASLASFRALNLGLDLSSLPVKEDVL